MNKVATIILNRNLPETTDLLKERIVEYDGDVTDVFVVEAGSDENMLSKNMSWHADWVEAKEHGLRYQRGMNYGLCQLLNEGRFHEFDAFFLLTNDTVFEDQAIISTLMEILERHPKVGLISPCSRRWGERMLLNDQSTRYFWYIHNNAYMLRREFIESIMEEDDPNYMNFLFDGTNFRGYGAESEIIAKGYANDWASAITSEVWVDENETYLLNQSDLIKTESYEENMRLYIDEGKAWMRRKYGFNSRWSMQMYVKFFYDHFFKFHPEYRKYSI